MRDILPLSDYFKTDSAYWGDKADWLVVYGRHRDSDTLAESNWRSFIRELGGESSGVAIERASHWAVGWVEYLLASPDNAVGLAKAREILAKLDDYPVVDEGDWTTLEDGERERCWNDYARQAWFEWFAKQCETEDDAEWFEENHGNALEAFLRRAYEAVCMGRGEAGIEPSEGYTLERAWTDSECAWWKDDPETRALAQGLELGMKEDSK